MPFNRVSIKDAMDLLKKDDLILIDIRDYNSFKNGHIENAIHIEDLNLQNFLNENDKNENGTNARQPKIPVSLRDTKESSLSAHRSATRCTRGAQRSVSPY